LQQHYQRPNSFPTWVWILSGRQGLCQFHPCRMEQSPLCWCRLWLYLLFICLGSPGTQSSHHSRFRFCRGKRCTPSRSCEHCHASCGSRYHWRWNWSSSTSNSSLSSGSCPTSFDGTHGGTSWLVRYRCLLIPTDSEIIGSALGFGNCLSQWLGVAFFHSDGQSSWRVPLAMQCIFPAILVYLTFLMSESPHWCRWIVQMTPSQIAN
jgi:hypothetical protein